MHRFISQPYEFQTECNLDPGSPEKTRSASLVGSMPHQGEQHSTKGSEDDSLSSELAAQIGDLSTAPSSSVESGGDPSSSSLENSLEGEGSKILPPLQRKEPNQKSATDASRPDDANEPQRTGKKQRYRHEKSRKLPPRQFGWKSSAGSRDDDSGSITDSLEENVSESDCSDSDRRAGTYPKNINRQMPTRSVPNALLKDNVSASRPAITITRNDAITKLKADVAQLSTAGTQSETLPAGSSIPPSQHLYPRMETNHERIEWQGMLTSVLHGDVIKSEKRRLSNKTDSRYELAEQIWLGIRTYLSGRTLAEEKRLVMEARLQINGLLQELLTFKPPPPGRALPSEAATAVRATLLENHAGQSATLPATQADVDAPPISTKHPVDVIDEAAKGVNLESKLYPSNTDVPSTGASLASATAASREYTGIALEYVAEILARVDRAESLYPSRKAMMEDIPLYASPQVQYSIDALNSWCTVTRSLHTQIRILQNWTGSEDLQIARPKNSKGYHEPENNFFSGSSGSSGTASSASHPASSGTASKDEPVNSSSGAAIANTPLVETSQSQPNSSPAPPIADKPSDRAQSQHTATPGNEEPSFIERILKENGLQSTFEKKTLTTLGSLLERAKQNMTENSEAFTQMGLPPYIGEVQQLLHFPTNLMEECLKLRLEYADRLISPTVLMVDQTIDDFRMSIKLACRIKMDYQRFAHPTPGWTLPPCIDENYDTVLLDSLRFYFKLLHWKLKADRKAWAVYFKEGEALEDVWNFMQELCPCIEGGDWIAAREFCVLVNRLLNRLSKNHYWQIRNPPELGDQALINWFNRVMENVRTRIRKLMSFVKTITDEFQNAAEYTVASENVNALVQALVASEHVLVYTDVYEEDGFYIIASPNLYDQPEYITRLMCSCFKTYTDFDESLRTDAYLLIISARDQSFIWNGMVVDMDLERFDLGLKHHRVRLVADSVQRLQACRKSFAMHLSARGITLDIVRPAKAHIPSIAKELRKIKGTIFQLAEIIMNSVHLIRNAASGEMSADLTENCFSFASDFGQRAIRYVGASSADRLQLRLLKLAIEWVHFVTNDCDATDRKTFRWAVIALEFAMNMTKGENILALTSEEFSYLRAKVACCMTLLISHFDIQGARSTHEAVRLAEEEKKRKAATNSSPTTAIPERQQACSVSDANRTNSGQRIEDLTKQLQASTTCSTYGAEDVMTYVRNSWVRHIAELERTRTEKEQSQRLVGKVLSDERPEDRSLVFLASSSSHISLRWQQIKFIGSGSFGSVYLAVNVDTGDHMAVKEIRFQDSNSLSALHKSIKEEMSVMEMLDHPNIVSYFGIEVHRDKVYIFMEYCIGEGTKVSLDSGRVINIEDVRVGDRVISWGARPGCWEKDMFSPSRCVLRPGDTVVRTMSLGKQKCWKIVLEDGRELVATQYHRILALAPDEEFVDYVEVKDLICDENVGNGSDSLRRRRKDGRYGHRVVCSGLTNFADAEGERDEEGEAPNRILASVRGRFHSSCRTRVSPAPSSIPTFFVPFRHKIDVDRFVAHCTSVFGSESCEFSFNEVDSVWEVALSDAIVDSCTAVRSKEATAEVFCKHEAWIRNRGKRRKHLQTSQELLHAPRTPPRTPPRCRPDNIEKASETSPSPLSYTAAGSSPVSPFAFHPDPSTTPLSELRRYLAAFVGGLGIAPVLIHELEPESEDVYIPPLEIPEELLGGLSRALGRFDIDHRLLETRWACCYNRERDDSILLPYSATYSKHVSDLRSHIISNLLECHTITLENLVTSAIETYCALFDIENVQQAIKAAFVVTEFPFETGSQFDDILGGDGMTSIKRRFLKTACERIVKLLIRKGWVGSYENGEGVVISIVETHRAELEVIGKLNLAQWDVEEVVLRRFIILPKDVHANFVQSLGIEYCADALGRWIFFHAHQNAIERVLRQTASEWHVYNKEEVSGAIQTPAIPVGNGHLARKGERKNSLAEGPPGEYLSCGSEENADSDTSRKIRAILRGNCLREETLNERRRVLGKTACDQRHSFTLAVVDIVPVSEKVIYDLTIGRQDPKSEPNFVANGIVVHNCQGGRLTELLEHGRIEDESVIQVYVFQMIKGLEYLHQNKIVHRDVKPDNILLDHVGVIKFVDFGAAKILANIKTIVGGRTKMPVAQNSLTGTPMYMAPEVITGAEKGHVGAQDIWSLGCCILEMATGKRPWSNLDNEWAVMYHVVTGHPPLPDASQLSGIGIEFVKLCFTRAPDKRPTAVQLLAHPWLAGVSEKSAVDQQWLSGSGMLQRHSFSSSYGIDSPHYGSNQTISCSSNTSESECSTVDEKIVGDGTTTSSLDNTSANNSLGPMPSERRNLINLPAMSEDRISVFRGKKHGVLPPRISDERR